MDWIPRTEKLPPEGEEIGVYDAFHNGVSRGKYIDGDFAVDNDGGRGTYVTHWCENPTPAGGPDQEEVHEICLKHF
jgi:hypothetical protein